MDRAYRFGQRRDVAVYRLLGAGSLEELVYARQVYKQQQMKIGYEASVQTRYFAGVQRDASRQGELFGIRNIFKLHEETLATKMAASRSTNVVDLHADISSRSSKLTLLSLIGHSPTSLERNMLVKLLGSTKQKLRHLKSM
jgi:hypothetical protein